MVLRLLINISTVLAGQRLGIKYVDEGIWLDSFMHYDLGYIGLEQRTFQIFENWSGRRDSNLKCLPRASSTLCIRSGEAEKTAAS
jgi:hypothetical protein